MESKPKEKGGISIDVKLLSHTNLVEVIQKLRGSEYPELLQMAQKELVDRLKQKGFNNQKIATLLTTNVYGTAKKRAIAEEWANALGVTKKEFLRLIGKR